MTQNLIYNKTFFKKVFTIALPIALQNLIISSINLADVFMIGKLGEKEIAALGLSNQIMFLLVLLLFGINSGGAIFMSQFNGKKDSKNMKKVLGIVLITSFLAGIIFFLFVTFIPDILLKIYTKDNIVVDIGVRYLKIVSFSYLFTAISFVYSVQLRTINKAKLTVYSSFLALIINITLNYLLIFGKFGFPKLGIEGAAIATTIARSLECIFIVFLVYYNKYVFAAKFREMIGFNIVFVKKYFFTTLPVLLNEMIWSFGIAAYNIIYARISTQAIASINIVGSVERILFVSLIGVASAASVMVGEKIGEQKEEEAFEYAINFIKLIFIIGVILSIILYGMTFFILDLYNISESVYRYSKYIMYILCFSLPMKGVNTVNIVGNLRAGGDTKLALYIDTGALWLIGVPLSFIAAFYFKLPVYLVYFVTFFEEITKAIFGIKRVFSKKWIKNLVKDID
ncbi:MAG: hypothetical protein PWP46_179 [Fusobacteriaceae bacterium]|jgi:putative MATE family efflux protein|nr:family efflux transporter [Fusobacteriales bacterium]MDN5303300.1 hypothetical protein [Fusobacteriaceae bacterium]